MSNNPNNPRPSEQDDDDGDDDRLRSIHAELSAQQQQQQSSSAPDPKSPWLPLESNPTIFTRFAHQMGLSSDWSFVDVLGFDDEMLQLSIGPADRSVAAAILLFPTTDDIYALRAREKKQLLRNAREGTVSPVARKAYHLEQVSSFGNACGTIACVHALSNAGLHSVDGTASAGGDGSGSNTQPLISVTGPLAQFATSTLDETPNQRGSALVTSPLFHSWSDQAATDGQAQTTCPERGDTYLGHHYCCFVPIGTEDGGQNHLVELDGTKVLPVDHGPVVGTGGLDFLRAVAAVVKDQWMSLEPDRIDFVMMALVKTG